MSDIKLDDIKNIILYDKNDLKSYLKENTINNIKVKYMITNGIFSTDKSKIEILYKNNWFDKEFLYHIEKKKSYFLILHLNEKYALYDINIIFNCFANIIENHNIRVFNKYFSNYRKNKNIVSLIEYKNKENHSLLSHAIFTCDKYLFMSLINLGMNKDIIDNKGYNLYDRLTLLNHCLISEEKIKDFINWMNEIGIDLETSKLKKDDEKMSNENYAYYQNLIREKNLNEILINKKIGQDEKTERIKSKI